MEARIREYIKKHEGLFLHSPTARAIELAEKYGFLSYMTQRYIEFMHEEVEEFLESCSYPLRKAIRCNTLKLKDCAMLEKSLKGKGFELDALVFLKREEASPPVGRDVGVLLPSRLSNLLGYRDRLPCQELR